MKSMATILVGLEIQSSADPQLFIFDTVSLARVPMVGEFIFLNSRNDSRVRVAKVSFLTVPNPHAHVAHIECEEAPEQ